MADRKTEEADVAGVIEQFREIKSIAVELSNSRSSKAISMDIWGDRVTALEDSYSDAVQHFNIIKGASKISLRTSFQLVENIVYDVSFFPDANLLQIITECSKALGTLNKMASPALTPDEIDRLGSLRQELEKISDINYVRDLEEAIGEYEKRHHLASALISSRMIVFSLDKIPGKDDEERVQHLVQVGKIEKRREDVQRQIIKAGRKARNFLSHDIGIFPKPEEALSLLGDCVTIVKLVP